MVAEDREGGLRKAWKQAPEVFLTRTAREQVAGEADQVRVPLGCPLDGAFDCDSAARGKTKVEIGEMDDAQPIQLLR